MRRTATTFTFLALATLTAAVNADDTPKKRSPELQVLDRFVGTWDIKVTHKPAGEEAATFDAVSFRRWSRGGNSVVFEDPGPDELILPVTYDPETKTYPGAIMIGTRRGLVTATWDEGKTTMHFKIEYPDGLQYEGDHRFIRKDYAEAAGKVTDADADGKLVVELSWKQTRRKETAKPSDVSVDKIVAKHLAAMGGEKAVRKQTTRKRTLTLAVGGGDPLNVTVLQKAPNLTLATTEVRKIGVVTEGFDGRVAWKHVPGSEARQLAGDELKSKLREYPFNRYIDLKSQFKTLAYQGLEYVKGKQYHVLKGVYDDGTEESLYLDMKTHLIGLAKPARSP